ncbi:diacylglycerol acyltransferase domain-containing protein [Ditylenchus destructor]|uniref:Acyltransferase n=1 Tax=Ditylenchus destructor TaxID=166010 RepID=A0AAD4MRY7_9BILA|nr:diacylglycerol acyltransferase domain-containing protein [Ditylenchus destructor]
MLLDSPFIHSILQKLAVAYYIAIFLFLPVICSALFIWGLVYTNVVRWLMLLYMTWMIYDIRTPQKGGRPLDFMFNRWIWRYFVEYFPIKLIKTTDLPPTKSYIFGSHPHGVLSIGAFASFCTNATGFPVKFPGLRHYLVTLRSNFYFPFRRELTLGLGCISADRESIEYALNANNGAGNAVIIVVGGAEEALDAHSDSYDLCLKRRKGFVRLAIKHGASLVPVYHFGENSIFRQVENKRGSKLRRFQQWLKHILGYSPPIFFGCGLFNKYFGLLPFRTPINTIVGSPIDVKQNDSPSNEEIDSVHQEYCDQLSKLFDDHKEKYGIPPEAKLNIY